MSEHSESHLNILLTNVCLRGRTGTEMMTAELAIALFRRGHRVALYSPRIGTLAYELRGQGIPVTDQIGTIGFSPDIIHGHHNMVLATAMVRFPNVPAIFVCHDSSMMYDQPILSESIGAYVAVDLACRDRLIVDGAAASRVHVVPNAVDLSRFQCRHHWQPKPLTALAVVKSRAPWLPAVRVACKAAGVILTEVGPGVGNSVSDLPERMLASDIVFAWSRSAVEAAATGAAVILCDEFGFGGLLTSAEAEQFPHSALGRRILSAAVTEAGVACALGSYSPVDAAAVAQIVRKKLSLDDMVDTYGHIYRNVIAASKELSPTPAGLAAFLERIMPRFDLASDLQVKGEAMAARLVRLDAWVAQAWGNNGLRPPPIDFSTNGLGPALLGPGWAAAEHWGVWSVGEIAVIDLPVSVITAWGEAIALDCGHFFLEADDQNVVRSVEVFAGSTLLARWNFSRAEASRADRQPQVIEVPGSLLPNSESVRLRFHNYALARPVDHGQGDDTRALGLFLRSIGPADLSLR